MFLKSQVFGNGIGKFHRQIDKLQDRKLDIETTKVVKISDLDEGIDFTQYDIDELYSGTPSLLFNVLHSPVTSKDKAQATYIDIGSGKGRALMQSMKLGFKKLIGVEFVSSIADQANANLKKAMNEQTSKVDCKVVCQDIRTYEYPETDLVLYLYNPFDSAVFQEFLNNLLTELRAKPRQTTIIYYHSYCSKMLDDCDMFERVKYGYIARMKLKILSSHSYGAWRFKPASAAIEI